MSRWQCLMVLIAGLLLTACGNDPAKELQEQREKAELEQLGQLKGLLTANNSPLDTDIQVFIGKDFLNQILQNIGQVNVPIPELGDTVLSISDAKIAFSNGYPAVSLRATVESAERKIKADVMTSAILLMDVGAGALDNSTVRLVVTGIAPTIKMSFFEFSLKGYWRDLANMAIQDKIKNLPKFSLPLSDAMPFSFGGAPMSLTFPTGNGSSVTGNLVTPKIASNVSGTLRHTLFLEDGLHLYLTAEVK